MDVQLLGPIEARLDGRPIALGPPKQRAVLAMLALRVGRAVSADLLCEGLWGEQPPLSAPKMVQLYVSRLRRVLDGNGAEIVTRGRGYELRLSAGEVDAVRFERLLEQSRAREALKLWRGEPLADVADQPFAAGEIWRLEELHVRAAEVAIDADLAAGRHGEVIGELVVLVAAHPLRERLQTQRMLALYRSGRQAEALEAYREARAALVERTGVEPGPELRRLHEAILAQDPALELAPPPRAPRRPAAPSLPRGHTRRTLAAAALLVLVGLTAFGISRVMRPDRLPGIDENAVGLIDPDDGRITAQYPVGRGPGAVVAGGGSVWVANTLDGTVSRIDRERDQVVTIPVGGAPAGAAFGAGSLWVADGDARGVLQIDPGANRVLQRIEVGNTPRAVVVAGDALWVASGVDGAVHRIDLDRPRERRAIEIGANPTALAAGFDAVWVASEEAGTVTRLEPRSGAAMTSINVGNGPSAIATGERAVWVLNRQDGTVSRIDPATNTVTWTGRVGGDPRALAAGGGAVWVAGGDDGIIARVDPQEPRVVETIKAGSSPSGIATAGDDVWAVAVAPQVSHRGGTLRVLFPPGFPIDPLDPAGYYWPTAQLTSLAYDGLVAYRRVGGGAGATLVGALATTAPPPRPDGRTYVFTLRPGLRYSNGTPVRPEDFRASMERLLRVTRHTFPPFYADIVGARRCVERPTRCDLSAGIETDPRARTITVHLTRPDAEFLHRLTLPFAYVVPADTPARLTGDRPPPGTGPYRVAAWDPDRGGILVRNPRFRPTSPQDRPPGFADRIEIIARPERQIEAQIADVQRGAADLAVLAEHFVSFVKPERLGALRARSPGQLHSVPVAATEWMFLNLHRRPFDDARVRRALNYATDRARIVELAGGRELAGPTCQIVPSGFPGYQPHCPYSAKPAPGRGWTAPDTHRARALVAQSGSHGERVVVWVPRYRREVGRYFVTLLDDLGFRASLRALGDDYFERIYDARSRAQIGLIGWGADFLSPSSFIQTNFTCPSLAPHRPENENASHFCDPQLARQIERALAAPGADAARHWAAADRRITDIAPAVPLTNRRALVFVSQRVGNLQHHLQWFTLLDQLWVR